ncbi:hypothetical protein Glove_406g98 [Diversispora epigaea]|uniref:Uncharacterized protein n=1 Tax=Diversispora epigaea TaxID=1348612 RepID=A0A397H2Q6_9GLOM|nr:hypothetical protein Glove_406g98 [Diversispora epigaea]
MDDPDEPMWYRALEAFKRGAELVHENPKILDILQDDAKKNADDQIYIAVFVSSENAVLRRMESRSSWSRAKKSPLEIGDLSKEESIKYLTEKRKINEKTEELYKLVGGRILELKEVANDFLAGCLIEEIKKKKLYETKTKFESAKLLKNQKYHEAGKQVINALLTSKEIDSDVFRKFSQMKRNTMKF